MLIWAMGGCYCRYQVFGSKAVVAVTFPTARLGDWVSLVSNKKKDKVDTRVDSAKSLFVSVSRGVDGDGNGVGGLV
jgi:hypothetical protein